MSNWQLTMVVGFPMITVLIGILVNQVQLSGLHGQFESMNASVNGQFASVNAQFATINAQFVTVNAQFAAINTQLAGIREEIRMPTGKVMELSDRVSHLEASQGGMR